MESYASLIQLLNKHIEEHSAHFKSMSPANMYQPMGYILDLGGKRVRPLLTLIACDLFNGTIQHALPSAMAVELFHNFSLIHDDILDKAPLRRANPTVHEKWNTDIAILSGDGMLVKAYDVLAQSQQQHIGYLLPLFSKTGMEVCEGQQMDMDFETQEKVSVEAYIQMITYKTAVLLGCSLQMGAICANTSHQTQQHVYEFGKHIGIAFQLLDDVLDVFAENKNFGKQIGGDIIANKKTYLLLKALELANPDQLQQLQALCQMPNSLKDEKVKQVTALYLALNVKELALNEANKHTSIALQHLQEIEADEVKKDHLKAFALQLLNRNK